ncbi:MAG: hypothetical protein KJ822_17770 [Proteobacteria bacterium]|nr:hypothetical protein [Pseudomonadota bacterium]MBU4357166.1 hypothetical protein [Pseudomonadota bacterium]
MAKPGSQTGSVPTNLPKTPPQEYVLPEHSFTLQAIMEIQKSIGKLTQAVETLTEDSKKNGVKLDDISHKVYAAQVTIKVVGGILSVISGVVLVLFWKFWAIIAPLIELKLK